MHSKLFLLQLRRGEWGTENVVNFMQILRLYFPVWCQIKTVLQSPPLYLVWEWKKSRVLPRIVNSISLILLLQQVEINLGQWRLYRDRLISATLKYRGSLVKTT